MDVLIGVFANIVLPLGLLLLGYLIGAATEKKHYKSIRARERESLQMPAVNLKKIPSNRRIRSSYLVQGSCVISLDYFKRFLASLRNLAGGRVRAYESLLDRARREAILRMKASCSGADLILNVRLENSAIGRSANSKKQIGAVEVLAYGTAVFYWPDEKLKES